ncbi:MAG: hypothetical protein CM15mP23_05790 [Cryomorphaceae bacterium]|nr:MAG: hypothetical protein CM15mP23_05790 [Cryomorphaceae bacterium]
MDITSSASDSDVKRAYRKMAMKYHPDKLSELSQAQQKMGKEKFLKVQEAYEAIKKKEGSKKIIFQILTKPPRNHDS